MSSNPQVTVAVLADVNGLRNGMQQAEQTVKASTDRMASTVQNMDLGAKFGKQAQMAARSLSAITSAFDLLNRAQGDALALADGLSQSLMMTGSKFAAVGGAAVQAGMAISEFFTGAQAEARAEAEKLAGMKIEDRLRAETRDLQRQLDILRETDPIRKAELDGARELARIRARAREEDSTEAARQRTAAEELLSIERTRQRVEEARKQTQKEAIRAPEGIIDTLTTSIGNTFRIAQRGTMAMLQQKATDAAQKTADNTRAMLDLMRRGTGVIA